MPAGSHISHISYGFMTKLTITIITIILIHAMCRNGVTYEIHDKGRMFKIY